MRLDKYLAENGFGSRTKAARAIAEGRVLRNGKVASPADEVREGDCVEVQRAEISFVSEGGFKLYKALSDFGESVRGGVFIDIGASTGGFTDCLLQSGADRVYAVDVGESQLDARLARDARVTVMDHVNARYLRREDFPEQPDGAVIDVSFISLALILPAAAELIGKQGRVFALIKPQFECGAKALDKHGIVKEQGDRLRAVFAVRDAALTSGLVLAKLTNAPLKPRKNVEYIALFVREGVALPDEKIREACKI